MVWNSIVMMISLFFLMSLWLFYISFKNFSNQRKESSAFECGFEALEVARSPFSLRFFYILLVFLMFDVELSFFLQIPFMFETWCHYILFIYSLLFFILLVGLMEEWREGLLSWRE